jgi:hypothetical protein
MMRMKGNSVPNTCRSEHYRGYCIVAAGEVCNIRYGESHIDCFSRKYLRLDIPPDLVLAMLIDEAQERIDLIFDATEGLTHLTKSREQRPSLQDK